MSIINADAKHLEDLVREWALARRAWLINIDEAYGKFTDAEIRLGAFAQELGLLV